MEAYALAKVCKLEGIKFRCFKYISDNADSNASLDWIDNCKKGAKLFHIKMSDF
jgi:adenosylhomocysteine nucleosidase